MTSQLDVTTQSVSGPKHEPTFSVGFERGSQLLPRVTIATLEMVHF